MNKFAQFNESGVIVEIHGDSRYPVDRKMIRQAVVNLLGGYSGSVLGAKTLVEVSLVGDRKMRQLNKTYRKLDHTTDVLSFPLEDMKSGPDGILRLGDIAVSFPQARKTAILMNRLVDKVVVDLVEHGLKHLLGEHHGE